MKILVTGGAGYIGSITGKLLQEKGHEVVVFDNLIRGHRENVFSKLIEGDLTSNQDIEAGLKTEDFDAVVHFAAYALAGESMKNPYVYFHNNILGGLNLLEYMHKRGINKIVFSSTCAIYGTPDKLPVSEDIGKSPESAYGESKLAFENILKWYDKIYKIRYTNLRYFNAAGGSLDGKLGEDHKPETHIIPLAIRSAREGKEFLLYGNDYETKDGTCVRDYIHVEDLAQAHVIALEKLIKEDSSDSFNLGTGLGHPNLEVIEMVKKISGLNLNIKIAPRRPGDPPVIYADNKKASEKLNFTPRYSDLETIVKTAWNWHSRKNSEK